MIIQNIYYTEEWGSTFIHNKGKILPHYKASYYKTQ